VERSGGLPGLRRVMILDSFQMAGMLAEEMERLKSLVRKEMPFGPRCLRWRILR